MLYKYFYPKSKETIVFIFLHEVIVWPLTICLLWHYFI